MTLRGGDYPAVLPCIHAAGRSSIAPYVAQRGFRAGRLGADRFRAGLFRSLLFVAGTVLIPLYLVLALGYTMVRTQPRRRYLRLNRYTLLLIPAFVAGVFLHGAVYAMFYPAYLRAGGDEGVFFVLAPLGTPFYLLLLLLKTIVDFFDRGRGSHRDDLSLAGESGGSG